MEQKSMTALISLFSRAYHFEQNGRDAIFPDSIARSLLSDEEYAKISESMSAGISFFNPTFVGNGRDALRWIVDNQLSPSPLGRAAYAEDRLERAVREERVGQYLVCGAGYDTFAYRRPAWAETLQVFELDLPRMSRDKRMCLGRAGLDVSRDTHFLETDFSESGWKKTLEDDPAFHQGEKSFSSLLGVSYYLSEPEFRMFLKELASVLAPGSLVVFDVPDALSYTSEGGARAKRQSMLADGAKEPMLASYSLDSLRSLLGATGYRIVECLTPEELTGRFFSSYNKANREHPITAFDNVNYCLAGRV